MMVHGRSGWRIAGLVVSATVLATAVACGGGVSQADYDTLKKDGQDKEQQLQSFQSELSGKVKEVTALQQQLAAKDKAVADAQKKTADAEKASADAKAQAGVTAGATVLQYSKVVPTNTPRPTATPLPPGVPTPTPVPAVRVPPEVRDEVLPFTFYVETLATSSVSKFGVSSLNSADGAFPKACNPNSIFERGAKLVWRFEVFDMKTGKRVTDYDEPTMRINLPNGEQLTPRYSRRAGQGPWTWASGWDIPLDHALGTFNYTISITSKDGRSFTWKAPALYAADETSQVQIIN